MTTADQLSPLAQCLRIAAQRGRELRRQREAAACEAQQFRDRADNDVPKLSDDEKQRTGGDDDQA